MLGCKPFHYLQTTKDTRIELIEITIELIEITILTNVITGSGLALPKGGLLQDNPKRSYLAKAYVKAAGFKKVMEVMGFIQRFFISSIFLRFFLNFENYEN